MITNQQWYTDQAEANLKPLNKAENEYLKKLKGTYSRTTKKLTDMIAAFNVNYDNPTYAQATQLLNVQQSNMAKEDAIEQSNNIARGDAQIKKDLQQIGNKKRLTRLDELFIGAMILFARQGNVQNKGMDNVLGSTLNDQYMRGLWTIGRGQGFSKVLPRLSDSRINAILRQPWSGANYSQSLWGDTRRIAQIVKQELTQGIVRGDSTQQMARMVRDKTQSAYYKAERLVRTEMTRVSTDADMQAYADTGITDYEYLATLDDRTSEICAQLDNEKFALEEKEIGVNAPPMHPNCRSTTKPVIGTKSQTQRRAKDAEGNSILVDGNTTYAQWTKDIDKARG